MNYHTVSQQLEAGELSLDFCGHNVEFSKKKFLEECQLWIDAANGCFDGMWEEIYDEEHRKKYTPDAEMRLFYRDVLERKIIPEQPICAFNDSLTCKGCGHDLRWVLEGKKIKLRYYEESGKAKLSPVCKHGSVKSIKGSIQVAGDLLFTEKFRRSHYPNNGSPNEFSLDNNKGLAKSTNYKAKRQNIILGKTENQISVYLHPSKESIIVSAKNGEKVIEEHEYVATIPVEFSKWEATDIATLIADTSDTNEYDAIKVNVEKGVWFFENYIAPKDKIYSRMKLEKKTCPDKWLISTTRNMK